MKKMTTRQIRAYVRKQTRHISDPIAHRKTMEHMCTFAIRAEKSGLCWRVPPSSL